VRLAKILESPTVPEFPLQKVSNCLNRPIAVVDSAFRHPAKIKSEGSWHGISFRSLFVDRLAAFLNFRQIHDNWNR
jgi:hypothetical protein